MAARKDRIILFFLVLTGLSVWVVLEGLTKDASFLRFTDFSKIQQLYQPIKDNPKIKIIAAYPMNLSNMTSSFPPGYELLGQMVHKKILVGGIDPFTPNAAQVQSSISDIFNPQTIDKLTEFDVDTVLIHDQLIYNATEIVGQFKQDRRLIYLGHYAAPYDEHSKYISNNDRARSIEVFQIKDVVENAKSFSDISSDVGQLAINYQRAYKISITASETIGAAKLYFRQPYSPYWKLYLPKETFDFWGIAYLWEKPLFDDTHQMIGEFGNRWTINSEELGQDFRLVLCFKMQLYYNFFRLIAALTFLICFVYISVDWARMKNKKR